MPKLLIPELDQAVLERLRERASSHGRTPEAEAKLILSEALRPAAHDVWAEVDAICDELVASGQAFSDSAELLREDRER